MSFVSKQFWSSPIARDIVQIDDIIGTNIDGFPILNVTFQDENGKIQLLAFSVVKKRDVETFSLFLEDLRQRTGCPRVIVCDRYRPQISAIESVMEGM